MSTKESGGDLRALAQAATPGPWEVYSTIDAEDFVVEAGRGLFRTIATPARRVDYGRTNAAFIAAANPTAVLALLDRLEAAEAAVDRVRALADKWTAKTVPYVATSVGARGHVSYIVRRSSDDYADALREALDPQ